MMEERYHATTQNRFYPDMSNVNKNITVEAKLISPPTYIFSADCVCVCVYMCVYIYMFLIRKINNDYFPINHELIVLCNVDTVLFVRLKLTNIILYIYDLDKFWPLKV
jgi:hypothetical protein